MAGALLGHAVSTTAFVTIDDFATGVIIIATAMNGATCPSVLDRLLERGVSILS